MCLQLLNEALAALRVCITAVHKAMYIYFVQTILCSHIQEGEQLVN